MIDSVLTSLLATSVQVTLLILVVALVQRACWRLLTPRWRYGLWLLVLARLALPIVPDVNYPRFALGARPAQERGTTTHLTSARTRDAQAASMSREPRTARVDTRQVLGAAPEMVRPQVPTASLGTAGAPPEPEPIEAQRPELARGNTRPASPEQKGLPWRGTLFGIWLAGCLWILGTTLYRGRLLSARVRRSKAPSSPRIAQRLERARERVGLRKRLAVVEFEGLTSPCIFGCLHPTLLWPRGLEQRLDDDQIDRILHHELAHVRSGDVALGLVAHLLASLYWFHPAVRLAMRSLRAAQESVRDWQALASTPSAAPNSYARTLLDLASGPVLPAPLGAGPCPDFLDRGRDMKRRILMIQRFGRPHRAAPFLGAGSLIVLAALGFTRPAPAGGSAAPTSSTAQAPEHWTRIEVERASPQPSWWEAFQARLDQPLNIELRDVSFSEGLAVLREATGIDIVASANAFEEYGDPEVSIQKGELRVREWLDLLCTQAEEFEWETIEEAIYISEHWEAAGSDLRFYKIEPFLDGSADDAGLADDLTNMVIEYTDLDGTDAWEREWVSIEALGRLLVVRQTPQMHARISEVLEHLLNRAPRSESQATPAWRQRIETGLQLEFEPQFDSLTVEDITAALQQLTGLTIFADDAFHEEEISLELGPTTVGQTLSWTARQIGAGVRIESGAVRLAGSGPAMELCFHELEGLLDAANFEDPDDLLSFLQNAITCQVDPELWDSVARASVHPWRNAMLVTAPPETQARIAGLLAALERAFN